MPSEILVTVLATLPIIYGSFFLHELGHVVMARVSGYFVTSFGLGVGQPFRVWGWRGTRVYLCRRRPLQGITFVLAPQLFPGRLQAVGMLAGGALANSLLMATALALWRLLPWGAGVWLMAAGLNAVLGIANLIPFTFRAGAFTLRSDGALIVKTLRHGIAEKSAPALFQMVAALRPLWEGVGDTTILHIYLLQVALRWIQFGDAEQAQLLYAEAEALPAADAPPAIRAYTALLRGFVACAAGKPEIGADALAAAEKGFRALEHEAGLLLVSMGQAELLLLRGDAPGAVAHLQELASHALVARQPLLRAALLASRLSAEAALPGAESLGRVEAEYEEVCRVHPSLARDLSVFKTLARFYDQREDWPRAESAYQKALSAAQALHEQFADAADQERFRQAQAGLLAGARGCLLRRGKEAEASQVEALLPSAEGLRQRRAEAEVQRTRRVYRWGLVVTLVNLLCALCGLAAVGIWVLRPPDAPPGVSQPVPHFIILIVGLVALLSVFTALAILLVPLLYILGRWSPPLSPPLRQAGGAAFLTLTLVPWFLWVALLLGFLPVVLTE